MESNRKTEIDRLAALANIGAESAADAYSKLVGEPIRSLDSIILEAGCEPDSEPAVQETTDWSTGVFFEFSGCLDAIVGILVPDRSAAVLLDRIVGDESGERAPAVIESALMEVGNMLASHVASAIADDLGSRLLPSIPSLAIEAAEQAFRMLIEAQTDRESVRIESALVDEAGRVRGRLVLVPTRFP